MRQYKFAVVGAGYVGMSLAILLSKKHIVYLKDVVEDKINMINSGKSPIHDDLIDQYLKDLRRTIKATQNSIEAYAEAEFVIIAVPTNFDLSTNYFDTSIVESVLKEIIDINKNAYIIIKSTVPVGFTELMMYKYQTSNVLFCPEFLRESNALYDNLHPSRIIIGTSRKYFK